MARIRPYMNPYLAGVGIGVVLLLSFLLVGRGLGATGAYSAVLATSVAGIAPQHVIDRPEYTAFLGDTKKPLLNDWLVIEMAGVLIGALLSALWAGRFKVKLEYGPQSTGAMRLLTAFSGGMLMGIGAKLARGCTSGQGLTGGAMLSLGSWLFIVSAFGLAYLLAPLLRKQWI